jgi:hypothetical protein
MLWALEAFGPQNSVEVNIRLESAFLICKNSMNEIIYICNQTSIQISQGMMVTISDFSLRQAGRQAGSQVPCVAKHCYRPECTFSSLDKWENTAWAMPVNSNSKPSAT